MRDLMERISKFISNLKDNIEDPPAHPAYVLAQENKEDYYLRVFFSTNGSLELEKDSGESEELPAQTQVEFVFSKDGKGFHVQVNYPNRDLKVIRRDGKEMVFSGIAYGSGLQDRIDNFLLSEG